MTLEQLSAAATQGEWRVTTPPEDWGTGGVWVGTNPYEYASNVVGASCCCCGTGGFWDQDDANFAVALVNAYRTGQLVEVQADDATVERVKDAIGTSLAYDIGMDVRAGSLTDDEKRKVARKAIAAMPSQADLQAEIERLRIELQNIAETTDDDITSRQAFIALSKGPKL